MLCVLHWRAMYAVPGVLCHATVCVLCVLCAVLCVLHCACAVPYVPCVSHCAHGTLVCVLCRTVPAAPSAIQWHHDRRAGGMAGHVPL